MGVIKGDTRSLDNGLYDMTRVLERSGFGRRQQT